MEYGILVVANSSLAQKKQLKFTFTLVFFCRSHLCNEFIFGAVFMRFAAINIKSSTYRINSHLHIHFVFWVAIVVKNYLFYMNHYGPYA